MSLADTAGTLHHAQKSALGHILEEGISVETLPASEIKTCTILDGQALAQVIGKPKATTTFGDLARDFSSACLSYLRRPCTRIDVVFDRYENDSIKTGTREFWKGVGSKRPIRRIINDAEVPLSNNWNQFINLEENKADLAKLIYEELCCQIADGEMVTAGGFETPETPDVHLNVILAFYALHMKRQTRVFCFTQKMLYSTLRSNCH